MRLPILPETVWPELVELAGGINLFGQAGKHSPIMAWQDLVDQDPEVIVVLPCGWDTHRSREDILSYFTSRVEIFTSRQEQKSLSCRRKSVL